MDRLQQIKAKIERAKTYGMEPSVTLADVEWLIGKLESFTGLMPRTAEKVLAEE